MVDATLRTDPDARQRAIRILWQLGTDSKAIRQANLYCILDAARDEQIHPDLRRLAARTEILPLYQGTAAIELAAVAPYLVCLGLDDLIFDWIWESGWGQNWGVFVWSVVTPMALRNHFRRLTKVRTETGQVLIFRFYDPRVLAEFLPTCDAGQLADLFGPVNCFVTEADEGQTLVKFRLQRNALVSERTSLGPR
ncbi:MAG TPA: DUF4123 domain-containing protein [Acetobacteraceae bacterium]|nr:DUF4123 domain-containing protein [Acetobacteraceae bacterium]